VKRGFRNKDREIEDLFRVQSTHWHAQGQEEVEKLWRQWVDEFHHRLVVTQTLIFQVLQGVPTYYKSEVDYVYSLNKSEV